MSILLLNPPQFSPKDPDSSIERGPPSHERPTPGSAPQAVLTVAQGTGVGSESTGH